MSDYLLVTNSAAGSNDEAAVAEAAAVLEDAGSVEVVATGSPEELDDVVAKLRGRTLVVAGGDGSLHAVVNALYRRSALGGATLGLVPLGTGNDFARGSGIPLDPADAARLIADGTARPMDLAVDSHDTVTVNGAHLGVGADASRAGAAIKPKLGVLGLGRLGYLLGALVTALRPHFLHVLVSVDGRRVHTGRVTQVALGNGSHVGGGAPLVPGADPTDGSLTVIVSRELSGLARWVYALRLRRGEHHLMQEVTRVNGRTVHVSGEEFCLSTDGEISGPHTECTWRLVPAAVRMHLPA